MISVHDLFPVRFFQSFFPNATDVLQEVVSKRKDIKVVSEAVRSENSLDYLTDYSKNVKINSFEEGFKIVQDSFDSQGLKVEMAHYWTAFYKRNGSHGVHLHKSNILDKCNYSCVLYLSNLGSTTFFAPSEPCFEKEHIINSEFGKFIMFPNTLLHAYHPGHDVSSAERIIMSFNLRIGNQ